MTLGRLRNLFDSPVSILFMFILLGVFLRLFYIQEPVNSDDINYMSDQHVFESLRALSQEQPKEFRYWSPTQFRLSIKTIPWLLESFEFGKFFTYYGSVLIVATISLAGLISFAWVSGGPWAAGAAAFFWATNAIHIHVDTRLTPDALGVGFGLLALTAALLSRRDSDEGKGWTLNSAIFAVLCGLFLWLAWSSRATFAILAPAALLILVPGMLWRRRLAVCIAAGLTMLALEWFAMWWITGDGFYRINVLLGYGEKLSNVQAFHVKDLSEFLLRYPALLDRTAPGTLILVILSLGGLVLWLRNLRSPATRGKLVGLLLSAGLIFFALSSFDPLIPLMRDKQRYFAAVSPFFILAAVDFIIHIAPIGLKHARQVVSQRVWPASRNILPLGLAVSVLIASAFVTFLDQETLANSTRTVRGGNSAFFSLADFFKSDLPARDAQQATVVTDFRTIRVGRVMLPAHFVSLESVLKTADAAPEFADADYLLLSWHRLNTNVFHGYLHSYLAHGTYDLASRYPIVLRHRNIAFLTDLLEVGGGPISRELITEIDLADARWSSYRKRRDQQLQSHGVLPQKVEGRRGWFYTDCGKPWTRPKAESGCEPVVGDLSQVPTKKLDKGALVFASLKMRADPAARVRTQVFLYWWDGKQQKYRRNYMGRAVVTVDNDSYTFWTWVPEPLEAYRLAIRTKGAEMEITKATLRFYERHANDRLITMGDAR